MDTNSKIIFSCLFVFISGFISFFLAQEAPDIIEEDISVPKTTLIQETLEELIKNPLDLNSASYDDLLKIPYLTPILAYQILEARKNKGNFKSVSELIKIPGIDNELIEKIKSLITVKQLSYKTKTSTQFRFKFNLDTLSSIGKTKQWEINSRANFLFSNKNTNLRVILLTDKDANEKRLTDFSSASASIATKNNKLILGNYVLNFGSQVLFSGPYSFINSTKNFSLDPLKSINKLSGLYEHSSLFGIGFFQVISNFDMYSFLSSSFLDADIKNGAVKKVYYYTKYTDSTSQARRNQLREDLIGLRATYSPSFTTDQALLIGVTAYHNNYDKPFAPTDSTNSFYGSSLNLISADFQTKYNNYFLQSEFGYSMTNGFGGASRIIGDWHFLKVNLNIYAQQKDFFSPHSKWRGLNNRKDKITGSFNIFYNLSGFKMYFLTSTQQDFTTDSLPARIQYRLERKQGPINLELTLKGNYKESRLNTYGTRFDCSYQVINNLELYSRLEDRYVKGLPNSGRLFYIGGKFYKRYFTIEPRLYYFAITSSDCKLYAYESSTGSYGFNNHGIRIFTSVKSEIGSFLKINYLLGYTKTDKKNLDTALQFLFNL